MNKHLQGGIGGRGARGKPPFMGSKKILSKKYISFTVPFKAFPKSIFWPLEIPVCKTFNPAQCCRSCL